MSALSAALGQDAAPHTFTHAGKVYPVSLIDQRAKTAFEKWLYDRACKTVASWQGVLSEEQFVARLDKVNDDFLVGNLDLMGSIGQRAIGTIPGMIALIGILFSASPDESFEIATTRTTEVKGLLAVIFAESFPTSRARSKGGEAGQAVPNA